MKFTEASLEQTFIQLLEQEGYPHVLGNTIVRPLEEVLIEEDLLAYLLNKYASKQLTITEAKSIILQLKTLPASDLYETNKTIMRWLSDGFILKREDRNQKDIHIELIDYKDLESHLMSSDLDHIAAEEPHQYPPNCNIYKFVNQLEIIGTEKRIPDGILYINGLPVVVFEFKSAIREEATVFNAFEQLTVRYRRDIPELFKYNAFCVISDGVNNKAGSVFAPYDFFYAWRRLGVEKLQLLGNLNKQELIQTQKESTEYSKLPLLGNLNKQELIQTQKESTGYSKLQLQNTDDKQKLVITEETTGFSENKQELIQTQKESTGYSKLQLQNTDDKQKLVITEETTQELIQTQDEAEEYSKLPLLGNLNKQELIQTQEELIQTQKDVDGINSMFTLIQGMLNKNRILDIIRNFIYIPDTSKKNEKIVCRYPQYYAAKRLFENIKLAQRPKGDGKGGTYFGATGCGKSFTMLYLARLLMKSEYFESPTIVMITDRTDLDDQLSGQFTNAKKFVGDNTIISVESRANLRELIQGRQSGGVFLTTIHKFTEDAQLLSDRNNIICISDEAHRSQTNLDQKIKITEKGVSKTFGFAKYLHDSLPNATFVGFTGTPIDATLDVFGKVIDSYTMTESVRDEITVRIVYEGRAAKVALNNSELERIEKYYEEAAEAGANEYQIDKSKEESASMNAILGDPKRLRILSEDFVTHYENRISEGATVLGKAMFVCSNREIAYEFYKNIISFLGERSSSFEQAESETINYAQHFTKDYGYPEEWHKGNLPHRNKEGLIQFITFRLADSLPQNVLKEIEEELKGLSDSEKDIEKRLKYEKWLDSGLGCCALSNQVMAEKVQEALKYHDGDKYNLLAWSIMPNHVHVLIKAKDKLSKIIQSWKSFTGKWALQNNSKYNLGISKEAKEFWMPEYWDRFIRDEEHFNSTIRYILNNPVLRCH